MISVIVLGSGNVATHLISAFLDSKEIDLIQVYARTKEDLSQFSGCIEIVDDPLKIKKAQVLVLAVSDNAIAQVADKIELDSFLVHTSGVTSMDVLGERARKGVFYMLQSFSKEKTLDFNEVPFCLEANNESDLLLLEQLAKSIGSKIFRINERDRQYLHVSAVFVNNFVNHMYHIGHSICNTHNIPFEILSSLIKETTFKIGGMSPYEAQTGPAIRNDSNTIQKHLSLLNGKEKEIYKILSKSIQDEFKL